MHDLPGGNPLRQSIVMRRALTIGQGRTIRVLRYSATFAPAAVASEIIRYGDFSPRRYYCINSKFHYHAGTGRGTIARIGRSSFWQTAQNPQSAYFLGQHCNAC